MDQVIDIAIAPDPVLQPPRPRRRPEEQSQEEE
jgi:hypothetical protein